MSEGMLARSSGETKIDPLIDPNSLAFGLKGQTELRD